MSSRAELQMRLYEARTGRKLPWPVRTEPVELPDAFVNVGTTTKALAEAFDRLRTQVARTEEVLDD